MYYYINKIYDWLINTEVFQLDAIFGLWSNWWFHCSGVENTRFNILKHIFVITNVTNMSLSDLFAPIMDWDSHDLPSVFALFKQKCNLYFSARAVKPDKWIMFYYSRVNRVFKLYNSWYIEAEIRTKIFVSISNHILSQK